MTYHKITLSNNSWYSLRDSCQLSHESWNVELTAAEKKTFSNIRHNEMQINRCRNRRKYAFREYRDLCLWIIYWSQIYVGFEAWKRLFSLRRFFFSSIPDINALIALFNNVWTRNGGTKYSTPTRIPWNRIELLLFNLLFLFACVQVNVFSLLYQVPQFDDYSS